MNPDDAIFILTADKYDLFLIERGLQYLELPNPVRVSRHANEAACYFEGCGIYAARDQYPIPGLLILDLQLPENASFNLLQWLRKQRAFETLPIIATGVWNYSAEIQRAFDYGIHAYFRIPAELSSLMESIKTFDSAPRLSSISAS